MSLSAFLRRVVDILDEAGVPYMLTGSLAAAYYATPRSTQDIDVVVDAEGPAEILRLVEGLAEAGLYVDREAALGALRSRGQFNAIDPESGWKVDLIIRKDRAFSRCEFDRRQERSLLGVEIALASLEDVIIAKLEWGQLGDSELQRRDVAQLIQRSRERIDQPYLERWIDELGLGVELQRVREIVDGMD